MAMDLRCPVCKSNKINYYSWAIAKYGSTDAQYVCEDCGYVGALILDVSIDESESKDKNPVESDLKEISKEIDDKINDIPSELITPKDTLSDEIKNVIANGLSAK